MHIGGCAISASNGERTTKINKQLVAILTTLAGYDTIFEDPRELR